MTSDKPKTTKDNNTDGKNETYRFIEENKTVTEVFDQNIINDMLTYHQNSTLSAGKMLVNLMQVLPALPAKQPLTGWYYNYKTISN